MALFGLLKDHQKEITLGTPRDHNEVEMMAKVNRAIEDVSGKSGITLKLGNYTFHHVIGMNSNFPGDPKADVAMVSVAGGKATEVAFISFKKAGGAEAFQQYSGLTEGAGLTISNDPIVVSFLKDAGKHIASFNKGKNMAQQGTPAAFTYVPNNVPGRMLVDRAVFGPKYKKITSREGLGGHKDNVHVIAQGTPILKKNGAVYELMFSEHVFSNNQDLRWVFTGEYAAVLGGTFRNGRGFTVKGQRFTNFRVGLYPFKMVGHRKGAEEL